MTHAIQSAASPQPSRPLRGTQPLPLPTEAVALPLASHAQDQSQGLTGSQRLLAAAHAPSAPSRDELLRELEGLLETMPPHERQAIRQLFERTIQDLPQSLADFRDELQSRMKKFLEFVESRKAEHTFTRAAVEQSWLLFYQSLDRYLEYLKILQKVEETIVEQRQMETRSLGKLAERLLASSATQAPEHRVSLLSAKLGSKLEG
jgi:hypothetical protein